MDTIGTLINPSVSYAPFRDVSLAQLLQFAQNAIPHTILTSDNVLVSLGIISQPLIKPVCYAHPTV